ncbi:MAG TPA: class I SAM-dependent methyltransferase [Gaiellaceae bacterium]
MSDLYTDLADVYDAVFEWDMSGEADWLVERLGPQCKRVLEPGCGAGRMFGPLAERGLDVTGIDSSPAMVELAQRRGRAVVADMTDFDLGTFDGAVCPINTLGHLSRAELALHLRAMSRALVPDARYLVQLAVGADIGNESRWEIEKDGLRISASWLVESRDAARGTELHRSVFEVLAGPRAGERHEQVHEMTYWTTETWGAALAASPFEWAAVYDGVRGGWPRVGFDAVGGLLWHELVRS